MRAVRPQAAANRSHEVSRTPLRHVPSEDARVDLQFKTARQRCQVCVSLASDRQRQGRFEEAIELQRRAVEADPLSIVNRYDLGAMLYLAGRAQPAASRFLNDRPGSAAKPRSSVTHSQPCSIASAAWKASGMRFPTACERSHSCTKIRQ